jgi:DNA-binding SARP family transcriptional activator/Flp pilus assembly protein TadD
VSGSATFARIVGHIECRFLGGAELLVARAPVTVDTRKAIAIVAYLSVQGSASRDTLASLFWPDSNESRARSSLRRTLSSLRTAADGAVVADRATVRLAPEVGVDVSAFHDAIAAIGEHDHPAHDVCRDCVPSLELAATLYRGDFLAGFSLRDAPDFDDWVRPVAEGLRLECASALERLATGKASVGDYRGAVEASSRWIELDPLHEPAHRHLMLLAAWEGDRAGAIDAYRRCVAVLNDELGVAPLEETTELYEAILDDDLPPRPSARRRVRAAVAPEASAPTTMIDRAEAIETLERELMWASTGGRVVVLSGGPWMGKTRIIEDFAARTADRGNRVLMARGYRAEQHLAYGAIIQLIRTARSNGWLEVDAIPDWALAETSRLLPEIGATSETFGDLGEARLYEAIATVLLSIATGHVLVLTVDDAQWLDSATVSLLSYLTHRIGDAGVLILIGLRPWRDVAEGLRSPFAGLGTEVELEPLTPEDLVGLVDDAPSAASIIDQTGGVPLLVAEVIGGVDTSSAAAGVRRYIDDRLGSLDGLAMQIVSAVSTLGGDCDLATLRETSGRSEDEVADTVDRLIRERVLRQMLGMSGIGFALDAMDQIVYEGLTPIRRQLLHRRAAAVLISKPGTKGDLSAARTVAQHLQRSGQDAEACSWYVVAGNLASRVYAHTEAVAAYRSALALHPADPGPIHLALGDALLMEASYIDASVAFQAAASVGEGPVRSEAEHRLGEVNRRLGRFDLAEQHYLLAEARHPDPTALYADWALLQHRRGDTEGAARRARQAVDLAEHGDDRVTEARTRNIVGIVTDDRSELERALELAGQHPTVRMAALNSLAYVVANDGDLDRAGRLVAEAIDLSEAVGDRHRRAALLNHAADIHHRAGREEDSKEAFTAAARLFSEIQRDAWEPEVWLLSRW